MASPSIHSPASSTASIRPPSPPSITDGSGVPHRAGTIHLTPYSQPPPYTLAGRVPPGVRPPWASPDPRSSSTQSLVPSDSGEPGRRTLLLVYIHGFLGNETSFQSFPAHVHNLLKIILAETHVIHTKIYPRYKSRKAIEFARDDFSKWLSPHESEMTDVILLGHSMGGILSAEVVLLQPHSPADSQPFRHRILGTINFDTPFLGMHPGVIVSGIGSLFRPSPAPTQPQGYSEEVGSSSSFERPSDYLVASPPPSNSVSYSTPASSPTPYGSTSTLSTLPTLISTDSHHATTGSTGSQYSSTPSVDPNYNPPFSNDVRLSNYSGWEGALNFVVKYSGSLPTATKHYITSHLEFGGCLADYNGLKSRYAKIRRLEDIDVSNTQSAEQWSRRRVRFANYYTASTGRPKTPSTPGTPAMQEGMEASERDISKSNSAEDEPLTTSALPSPRASIETYRSQDEINSSPEETSGPIQEPNSGGDASVDGEYSLPSENEPKSLSSVSGSTFPPIPPAPEEPPFLDTSQYPDKDTRKLAEKEYVRAVKAYKQAVKDHNRTIKDRKKLVEKFEKKAKQERERETKIEGKARVKEDKNEKSRLSSNAVNQSERGSTNPPTSAESNKRPPRDKKFCMLPPKVAGRPDPTWIRVFMEGVDEVGAHCGLFFVGGAYERLVGDVGSRIEDWVGEEETRRAIIQLEESYDY
ncbi:hypothetical protein FGG08_005474 [Glutinoglossum americanum]|uniref:DUF676 domain-containing protein n=1 Tax=Glutinoglossum americanum TaxID=1670608 RepID=A0A9P8HYC8_9PEZI|nr:hypothetical protein FGG08_005474 [Glutinoglossum americanum]